MALTAPRRRSRLLPLGLAAMAAALAALVPLILLAGLGSLATRRGCRRTASAPPGTVALLPPGVGERVGATEYGGPGDPSSGHVGASGVDLDTHPDSYAELGGTTVATASAMGGLPFETPLRITWGDHSTIAYKRDIGLGGGPVDGLPRVIDLWWQLAGALGIPYEDGHWSGLVRVTRPPASGAGDLLAGTAAGLGPITVSGAVAAATGSSGGAAAVVAGASATGTSSVAGCGVGPPAGVAPTPTTVGPRARLLSDGLAAAPASAPAAVRSMIAAGNQIVGKPYVYGGGHGIPLDQVAPSYDCSSSVEHLLWGAGLVAADFDSDAAGLESFGDPGPGRWVTIYASADHVFMYVAGLRWDTHDAAGPGDGSAGIGWHPLIREDAGFVVRHPPGL